MAKFIQTNQQVQNQVNADSIGFVSFGNEQNNEELIILLNDFLTEVKKLAKNGNIEKDTASKVETHVKKAIAETKKPEPKKKTMLENIEGAKKLLEGITSATNLISTLIQAAKIVGAFLL